MTDPELTDPAALAVELRAAKADLTRFRALVESSRDFIAIAGLDARVLYVNPAGRAMVGLTPDVDVTTTTIRDYLTPEGIERSERIEQPAVVEHGHWEGESTLRGPDGTPVPVEIAEVTVGLQGEDAVLSVGDTGPGIAIGEQDTIFEKFARSRSAAQQAIPGLGLGLFISRSIVRAHDGEITAGRAPGGGAQFVVRLPLAAGGRPTPGR